jgi:hypothetical protein
MATPEGFIRLSVNVSNEEHEALLAFAKKQKRNKTEVVRDWLRGLATYQIGEDESKHRRRQEQ